MRCLICSEHSIFNMIFLSYNNKGRLSHSIIVEMMNSLELINVQQQHTVNFKVREEWVQEKLSDIFII